MPAGGMAMARCANNRDRSRRTNTADRTITAGRTNMTARADQTASRLGKLKILLAALILLAAFSINSYLLMRDSMPNPIDYNAVYESLRVQ